MKASLVAGLPRDTKIDIDTTCKTKADGCFLHAVNLSR